MENSKFKIQNSKLKSKKPKTITLPLTKDEVLSLNVGDMVLINGIIVTGRDKIHKFLFNNRPAKNQIPFNLEGAILYHCGPIIKKTQKGFELIAGGPTTSMRLEMYENYIISRYGLRGIMGKGGMGAKTLNAFRENSCVYLHAIGGAAVYLADRVKRVTDVWKLEEFGMSEAMWVFEVKDFPAIVTMDARGRSLHEEIERRSYKEFKRLAGL
ncbi:MAG: FumA C-terminus/TtdB family hydratase beta subunit [Nitrospirota bacterium]